MTVFLEAFCGRCSRSAGRRDRLLSMFSVKSQAASRCGLDSSRTVPGLVCGVLGSQDVFKEMKVNGF